MSFTQDIAKSASSCVVKATDKGTQRVIWFKSDPVDRNFCYRSAQLQLVTDSFDQGIVPEAHPDQKEGSSFTWFEVCILPGPDATTPRQKDGEDLTWRSHNNRLANKVQSRHFGVIFDRRANLLDELRIGDVIAVTVCAQYAGWINNAMSGRLVAKILDADLFCPNWWTIDSAETPEIPQDIDDGLFTLTSPSSVEVKSTDATPVTKHWFSTPALDENLIAKIEEIQLHTKSRDQGRPDQHVNPEIGSWSWFEICILESPEATEPKVKDGRALVWLSHTNKLNQKKYGNNSGKVFGRDHELLNSLEVGNVIAVRACAQFPGWENHARRGQLVVRVSNEGPHIQPSVPTADWAAVSQTSEKLKDLLHDYLDTSTGEAPPAYSVEADLLTRPIRADLDYGVGDRPLRLLSLDGGGVRGISTLQILDRIMDQVAGKPGTNIKPCDYFDMIAGTSTGGLIAIMLGRLRMSVDECIKAYTDLASSIFSAGTVEKTINSGSTGARFSAEVLEKAIKTIVKQKLNDPEALMFDEKSQCKVFVLANRANDISNQLATHLRTYKNPWVAESYSDAKIWEAGRATSAAPTYFPRMKIGPWEYVDGGLGFNNPILLLMAEARLFYGAARQIGCLLTIGTGMSPNIDLGPEPKDPISAATATARLATSLVSLATNCERAHRMAESLVSGTGCYYRFNVGEKIYQEISTDTVDAGWWLEKILKQKPKAGAKLTQENWKDIVISLDDYKAMPEFVKLTDKYLVGEQPRVIECAGKIYKA